MILCDHDVVEVTNLHRQLIHDTAAASARMNKAMSAQKRILEQNPHVHVEAMAEKVTVENARSLVGRADVVVDATDNVESRYIINDACMKEGKVLVSGSAVGMEGQISVFYPQQGPCYRCLYPNPSSLSSCRSCADAGVLGPIPGAIGCFQAMETLKVLLLAHRASSSSSSSSSSGSMQTMRGKQVLYDGQLGEFHTFQLPQKRREGCSACGEVVPKEEREGGNDGTSSLGNDGDGDTGSAISEQQQVPSVSAAEYVEVMRSGTPHVLLDVRSEAQANMASLHDACAPYGGVVLVHVPLVELKGGRETPKVEQRREAHLAQLSGLTSSGSVDGSDKAVYVLCRRGNDSQEAVGFLLAQHTHLQGGNRVFNITGGLAALGSLGADSVAAAFPVY
jgi:adenylyltransferase/sulfurtransferase